MHGLPLPEPNALGEYPTNTARDLARLMRKTLQDAQDATDARVFEGEMRFPTPEGRAFQSGFGRSVLVAELYSGLVWSESERKHYAIHPTELDWKYIAGGERTQR